MAKDVVEEDYPDAQIVVLDSQQDTVSQALIIDQSCKNAKRRHSI